MKEAAVERYGNLSGESGVTAYELGTSEIRVQFRDGRVYLYDYGSAGPADVERMKQLAVAGRGLSGFISRVVKGRYAARLK